ncbi:PEP/pyruvate-binding domain-containing protein [Chloroflexi bacterium TSY]|nr:PEP/pyruvate-binding domain-containing protein [Chloroflexi bacterium TSY]
MYRKFITVDDRYTNCIQRLSTLSLENGQFAGGKATNLARMIQAGLPVPDGFVVMSHAPSHDPEVEAGILHFFDELRAEQVAVRSSALQEDGKESSFAGFFDTFLCVDRETLLSKIYEVKNCQFTDATETSHQIVAHQIAVVVQPMIMSEISGVCFSVNPITGGDELLIEAVNGLGDELVSGLVTPDRYHIKRDTFEIIKKQLGHSANYVKLYFLVKEKR